MDEKNANSIPYVPPHWLCSLILGLVATVIFCKILFQSNTFFFADLAFQNLPFRIFYAKWLKAGCLPYWCPAIGTGFPLLAEGQTGMLFLPHLVLFFLLPPIVAYHLIFPLSFFTAALGMYAFVVAQRVNNYAGLCAGLIYGFSGYFVCQVNHINLIETMAFLPWIMLTIYWIFQEFRIKYLFYFSLLITLQFYAGHVQSVFISFEIYLLYISFKLISMFFSKVDYTRIVFTFFGLGIASLIAFMLFQPQFQASLNLLQNSIREEGLTLAESAHSSMPPWHVITLIFPDFFGRQNPYKDHGYWELWGAYEECCAFVGTLPLILAFIAIFGKRKKEVWFWSVLSVLFMLISFGDFTPIYHFIHDTGLPRYLRTPSRHLGAFIFAVAILAAFGTEVLANWLANYRNNFSRIYVITGAIFFIPVGILVGITVCITFTKNLLINVCLRYIAWNISSSFPAHNLQETLGPMSLIERRLFVSKFVERWHNAALTFNTDYIVQLLIFIFTSMILYILLYLISLKNNENLSVHNIYNHTIWLSIAVSLLVFGTSYNPVMPLEESLNPPNTARFLRHDSSLFRIYSQYHFDYGDYKKQKAYLHPNMNLLWNVQQFCIYSQLQSPEQDMLRKLFERRYIRADGTYPGFIKYLDLFHSYNCKYVITQRGTDCRPLRLVFQDTNIEIWIDEFTKPRVFTVSNIVYAKKENNIDYIENSTIDYSQTAVLDAESGTINFQLGTRKSLEGFTLKRPSVNRILLTLETQEPCFVCLSEAYSDNWQASCDGSELKIYRCNYLSMGFQAPQGKSEIALAYWP